MARYFNENEIDAFKECFYFHARKGYINSEGDLSIIVRSLGYCITKDEVKKYFKKHMSSEGRIDFASFLEVMHEHSQVENIHQELRAALIAQDRGKTGSISASSLRHILSNLGEKLTNREVDTLLKEAGMQSASQVKIDAFVETVMTPSPDY